MTLYGLDDGVADAAYFESAREAFSAPHELVAVPDAGHFLHREQKDAVARALLAFVGS